MLVVQAQIKRTKRVTKMIRVAALEEIPRKIIIQILLALIIVLKNKNKISMWKSCRQRGSMKLKSSQKRN